MTITALRCLCGELHPSALTLKDGRYICGNCLNKPPECDSGLEQGLCTSCKTVEPLHKHHVDGRAHSRRKSLLCVNCHQKLHRGKEFQHG